jgi:Putative Ig domain
MITTYSLPTGLLLLFAQISIPHSACALPTLQGRADVDAINESGIGLSVTKSQSTSQPPLSLRSVTANNGIADSFSKFGFLRVSSHGTLHYVWGGTPYANRAYPTAQASWNDQVTVTSPGMDGQYGYVRAVAKLSGPRISAHYISTGVTSMAASLSLLLYAGNPFSTTIFNHAANYNSSSSPALTSSNLVISGARFDQTIVSEKLPFAFGTPFAVVANLHTTGSLGANQGSDGDARFDLGTAADPYTVTWKRLEVYNGLDELIETYVATSESGFDYKAKVPVITSSGSAESKVGESFLYSILANRSPTSYAASGLPNGLTMDKSSGKIVGIPTKSGSFDVQLRAINSEGRGIKMLRLVIAKETTRPVIKVKQPGSGLVAVTTGLYTIKGNVTDNIRPTKLTYKIFPPEGDTISGRADLSGDAETVRTWQLPVSCKKPGVYRVRLFSRDAAGNESAVAVVKITRE